MEATWYRRGCAAIDQVCRYPHRRRKRQQFGDHAILKVFFFAVVHDRPVSWACVAGHWPTSLRSSALPSQSTMSRRLRSLSVREAMRRVHTLLCDCFPDTPLKTIDSKPLVVGNHSKDHDAKRGRAAGEMARGYKLHAIGAGPVLRHWTLAPMNVNDQVPAAHELLPKLNGGWGYAAGDNQYDANAVHLAAAAAGHQLIAPPRRTDAGADRRQQRRRNSAPRLRSLALCAPNPLSACGVDRPSFGQELLRHRAGIERTLGHLAMLGMFAPPPWVRRPHRMAMWVAAKLCVQMIRLLQLKRLRT
jgi:hypothetical protein